MSDLIKAATSKMYNDFMQHFFDMGVLHFNENSENPVAALSHMKSKGLDEGKNIKPLVTAMGSDTVIFLGIMNDAEKSTSILMAETIKENNPTNEAAQLFRKLPNAFFQAMRKGAGLIKTVSLLVVGLAGISLFNKSTDVGKVS